MALRYVFLRIMKTTEKKQKCLREFFKITRIAKKFDRKTGTFHISIGYKTAVDLTPRTLAVAQAFGLGVDRQRAHVLYDNFELHIGSTDIVYITGESGSGKSVLLRHLEKLLMPDAVNIQKLKIERRKPIIETVGKTLNEGLSLLSQVGLNDAFLFLRRYSQLSDGQKYRYRLAKLTETNRQYWILDEFCSTLDRDTAKIVAFNMQKIARKLGKAVLAATTHTDLFEDLQPSVHVHKRFGREVQVRYYPNIPNRACSLTRQMRIESGTVRDYKRLSEFHYREAGGLPPPRKIFSLKRSEELVGVIVYSYPPLACFGRKLAFPNHKLTVKELNVNLSTISRVVLHPKYRSIGLGVKIVRETLPLAGTPYIEAVAVMAKYNPFFEKAGMQKLAVQKPEKSCVVAMEKLRKLGFNKVLLASESYNQKMLKKLKKPQLQKIKEILRAIKHPRLRRTFISKKLFPDNQTYKQAVEKASIKKLAKALRVLSILTQTKIYLFWKNK